MLTHHQTSVLAAAVLTVIGLAIVVGLARVYRRKRFPPLQAPLYLFNYVMTRVRWRATIEGRVPFIRGQGAVIVSNHCGPIDPAFVAVACDRPVHWMVAREFCEHPAYGWALRILRVIPTNRGGIDTASIKTAVRYASQGDLVGMFPEGRINKTSKLLLPGRPGAALVALRARVPVVPCYLWDAPPDSGLFGFLFAATRTRIKIGTPIDLSPYYDQAGDRAVQEMLTLRFLAEIARLAGVPDYRPELAGRRWKHGEENPAALVQ